MDQVVEAAARKVRHRLIGSELAAAIVVVLVERDAIGGGRTCSRHDDAHHQGCQHSLHVVAFS
jgi:hypothetical protein